MNIELSPQFQYETKVFKSLQKLIILDKFLNKISRAKW